MADSSATDMLITKTPGVCGGDACIRNTRLPVWVLELHRRWGHSNERALESYPQLTEAELLAAYEYAAARPDEINEAIDDNQSG